MKFKKFYPKSYLKNIYEIDYNILKNKNIKVLIFDLDNTIALIDQNKVNDETIELFNKLKKDFKIVIISNNTEKRVSQYGKMLECDYVCNALKPLSKGYNKIKNKYNIKDKEICIIGDQLVTDMFLGNRKNAYTILVDPMGNKDLKITSLNRFIERKILNYYKKRNIFKKGDYYHGR